MFEREEFEDIFALAREESNPLATFEREGLAPFNDAILSLAAVEAAIQMAAEESPEDYDDGLPDEDEAASRKVSTGKVFCSSHSSAWGSMRALAKSRAMSRMAICSPVRAKVMGGASGCNGRTVS